MKNKFDPKAFLSEPSVKSYAEGYTSGHNDALESAAKWITKAAKTNGHPAAIELAKNIVATFRMAKMSRINKGD